MKKLITILILLIATTAFGLDIERSNYDTYDVNKTLYATKTSIHTFTSANWNEDASTWTMAASGPLVHVTGNTTTVTATLTEAPVITTPTTYKITITGTGGGATATYTFGGVPGTTIAATGAIAITDYITASTTASLIITPANTCTVSISNITIEKLTDATGDLTVEGNIIARSQIFATSKRSQKYVGYSFDGAPTYGFGFDNQNSYLLFQLGTAMHTLSLTSFYLTHDSAGLYMGANSDIALIRLAANSLALRNTTNAQTFSLYETYTDASNYESYSIDAGVTTADTFTIKANTAGTGADNLNFNITTTGTGVMSYTMADAASVAAARTTKSFTHTATLVADANDACGGTADCLTLPIPTTMGYVEIWTSGSLYLSAICVNAGTCTVITDSDLVATDIEYQAAIAGCTGLCLHDGGTNAIIFNDTAGALTVTVKMTYD